MLVVLAIALPVTIGVLKINALTAWRYTSDLFTVDTLLQETLRGHFTMEFVYGRQFGDHACLIFLALLPVKMLLGTKMVFALVLLPAITFSICGVILFKCASDVADARWAALATVVYFLSVGAVRGPFERVFGFHVDTLSGHVAVAMAALFWRYSATGRGAAWAVAVACVYALLKEETALLGVIFFLALLVFSVRTRPHIVGLILCAVLFVIEIVVIRLCRTGWNRGNEALVNIFTDEIQRYGVLGFFFSSNKIDYWCNVLGVLLVFALLVRLSRRLNPHAGALVIAGLAKLAFAWMIPDFYPWTWHNYPALVMLTGGVALQAIDLRHVQYVARPAVTALIIVTVIIFATREIPFIANQIHDTAIARAERDRTRHALLDIIPQVEPEKVASVPKWTAYEWAMTGHRYSFFPKGISGSVQGIADVLVTRRTKTSVDPDETRAFTLVYQNGHFRLWRRTGYLPLEEHSRGQFIEMFGREAIGLGPEAPKKKPAKDRRDRPATSATTRP